jgi:hypothetical protein
VTGWQSGDGGQGNWNQPPFGPDPGTNQYGTDPYANQNPYATPYPANPYEQNPYGDPNPYGGAPQQYGSDPYAQQQYPPTGGFPMPGYGPPPPKRSKLPMILSLVAIVIIIGAVVTIVLVNRQDNQPVAQGDPTTTSSTEKSGSSGKSTPKSTSSAPSGDHADWLSIDNTADSGLSYQVPPDWKQSTGTRTSGLGIDFTGAADYGVYDCEGANYVRTFAASGDVQGKDGKDLDLATTLEDFAKSFGTTYYGTDATVTVTAPAESQVNGKTAMTVTATVKQNVTKPNCQATEGEVALVGVELQTEGQPKGVAMLAVVNDVSGGPADPKCLDTSLTKEILSTVQAG